MNRQNSEGTGRDQMRDIFSNLGASIGRMTMAHAASQGANQTGAATRPNIREEVKENMGGIRARSTTIRTQNGNVFTILNIGVP